MFPSNIEMNIINNYICVFCETATLHANPICNIFVVLVVMKDRNIFIFTVKKFNDIFIGYLKYAIKTNRMSVKIL